MKRSYGAFAVEKGETARKNKKYINIKSGLILT